MVLESVHLLRDDVCLATNGAGEEISRLEDGQANFAKAVRGKDLLRGLLDSAPKRGLRGRQVARAFDGLEFAPLFFGLRPLAEAFFCCAFAHYERSSTTQLSFRAEQADFFFRVRSCERVGLRSRGISLPDVAQAQ